MKIAITGTPGSGKSTLARELAKRLGLKHYSIGDMRRKIARERSMTLAELNRLGESEDWTDRPVDEFVKKLGQSEEGFVIESRTAWHFIPGAIKIFLDAAEEARARRVLARPNPEEQFSTLQEVLASLRERLHSDRTRYRQYYGIDPFDPSRHDILLDNTEKSPQETLREALHQIRRWIGEEA